MRKALIAAAVIVASGFLLLVSPITLSASRAQAGGFVSGNKLHQYCTGTAEGDVSDCIGYITGVADSFANEQELFGATACFPDNSSRSQIRDVAKKWLAENPQNRHLLASSLVARALSDAFPCKK